MKNRIREHREAKGWTLERLAAEVAERTGIETSYQQMSRLEKGQRGLNDEWLRILAKTLGVSKASLLADAFVVPGFTPSESDFAKNETERRLLAFWRRLGPEAQDFILTMFDGWESRFLPPPKKD
jgi:transcriptional regulator with XRE-family HTH domain